MAISHLIAHRIERASPTSNAVTQLRAEEFSLDGKIEEGARELKLSFIKKLGKIHGRFSSDSGAYPVAALLQQCIDEKLGFVSFTHKAMQHLKHELDKTECVIEAFVFFVQESFAHSDELYMYVVHHQAAQYLDGELNMDDALYLDTANLKLAAKINLGEWQTEDGKLNYLSVLGWRGEKDLTDVFTETVGFTDKADIKLETEQFLEAVESYTEKLPTEEAEQTRTAVVNYCIEQDKAGHRVKLAELSGHINESAPKEFEQHVRTQKPELKPELVPDRGQMRQFIRISGRDDVLSMSFDAKSLGDAIVYDPDTDALIINKIPKSLKSRLLRHLKST